MATTWDEQRIAAVRLMATAVLAAMAVCLGGCEAANVITETLPLAYGPADEEETDVDAAGRIGDDGLLVVASGYSWYGYYHRFGYGYYEYTYPYFYYPYYYDQYSDSEQLFLELRIDGFPKASERIDLNPQNARGVLGKLYRGRLFVRVPLRVTGGTVYWKGNRPRIDFFAEASPGPVGGGERRPGAGSAEGAGAPGARQSAPPAAGGAMLMYAPGATISGTLTVDLSPEKFDRVLARFERLRIAPYMDVMGQSAPAADPLRMPGPAAEDATGGAKAEPME